jgi:hypothetical protein
LLQQGLGPVLLGLLQQLLVLIVLRWAHSNG